MQNHDWFTHGKNAKKNPHIIKPYPGDKDFKKGMVVPRTIEDNSATKNPHIYSKVFRNKVTHWWDASQIYGSDSKTIKEVRSHYNEVTGVFGELVPGGKLALNEKKDRLYYNKEGLPITGFNDNWWVGLELLHTLFVKEHNYIATKIKQENSRMNDEEIFNKARLVNSALIAKIHTTEWTPALLDNKLLHISMFGNWHGYLNQLRKSGVTKTISNLLPKSVKLGLTGNNSLTFYDVPFTLTEEFVAVYRMHPLIPENIKLKSFGQSQASIVPIKELVFRNTLNKLNEAPTRDWMYSMGTSHPGAMTLHNYPSFMQNMKAERNTGPRSDEDSATFDLAAVDVFRDRERGVPRYNDFRKALMLPPADNYKQITGNDEDAQILEDIYGKDGVNKVDLLVGTLAEQDRYTGYAFGNTPFYVFVLMASRRLMTDPFFSDYYKPEYYTEWGFEHVEKRTMADIIIHHYPGLKNAFEDSNGRRIVKNAFRPWLPKYSQVKAQISN